MYNTKETLKRAELLLKPKWGPQGLQFLDSPVRQNMDRTISSTFLPLISCIEMVHTYMLQSLGDYDPPIKALPRIGAGGKIIETLKFRSMPENTDTQLDKVAGARHVYNHQGIRFMRKSSLDEIPRFRNIYQGDMCLVGEDLLTDNEWASSGCIPDVNYRPGAIWLSILLGRDKFSVVQRIELSQLLRENITVASYLNIFLRTLASPFRLNGK